MSIQILSPRLANQIAAGEVVERPASVVKELVENALDAKATVIQIDIEKGGSKLVRIRDNGCGVPKEELGLALSRHATSKIATLDDLEAIISLGFRGEALASISSVCRLTFTSRTADRQEAWQANAQGRDMAVEITPAAHPVGTTVEVNDLFFNTPARRRFLRTDKTEFGHIDELIKRFALSRFDVHFILKHNGKSLRNLRPALDRRQQERRIASICGNKFMEQVLAVESSHNDIRIWGWLGLPAVCRPQTDMQYCYVNGRMMRDRLINHAIRQAYQHLLPDGLCPAYVLYIELDADQVDVNVHPAKHEVRFHQSRLVHDFIFQVLHQALAQADTAMEAPASATAVAETAQAQTHPQAHSTAPVATGIPAEMSEETPAAAAATAVAQIPAYPGRSDYQASASSRHQYRQGGSHESRGSGPINRDAVAGYRQLMDTPYQVKEQPVAEEKTLLPAGDNPFPGRPLSLVDEKYLLVEQTQGLFLIDLSRLQIQLLALRLDERWQQGLVGQPLLLPVAIKLDDSLLEQVTLHQEIFRRLGVDIHRRDPQIMVRKVPEMLRQRDLARLIPELLQLLAAQSDPEALKTVLCQWLAQQGVQQHFSFEGACQLLQEVRPLTDTLSTQVQRFQQPLSLTETLAKF